MDDRVGSIIRDQKNLDQIQSPDHAMCAYQLHRFGQREFDASAIITASTSSTPNVPVAYILATIINESGCGTTGRGSKNRNPGNVGNTPTGSKGFETRQDGLNAIAQNLASRIKAYADQFGQGKIPTMKELCNNRQEGTGYPFYCVGPTCKQWLQDNKTKENPFIKTKNSYTGGKTTLSNPQFAYMGGYDGGTKVDTIVKSCQQSKNVLTQILPTIQAIHQKNDETLTAKILSVTQQYSRLEQQEEQLEKSYQTIITNISQSRSTEKMYEKSYQEIVTYAQNLAQQKQIMDEKINESMNQQTLLANKRISHIADGAILARQQAMLAIYNKKNEKNEKR